MREESIYEVERFHYGDEELILARRHPDGREFVLTSNGVDAIFSADEIIYEGKGEDIKKNSSYLYARNGDEYALILPKTLVRVVASGIDDMKKYRRVKEKKRKEYEKNRIHTLRDRFQVAHRIV